MHGIHRNYFSRKEGKGLKAAEGIGVSVGTHGSCVRIPDEDFDISTKEHIFSSRRVRRNIGPDQIKFQVFFLFDMKNL